MESPTGHKLPAALEAERRKRAHKLRDEERARKNAAARSLLAGYQTARLMLMTGLNATPPRHRAIMKTLGLLRKSVFHRGLAHHQRGSWRHQPASLRTTPAPETEQKEAA